MTSETHAMLLPQRHDDRARQMAVRALRQRLLPRLAQGVRAIYYAGEDEAVSEAAAQGEIVHKQVRDRIGDTLPARFQLGVHRTIQELMYQAIVPAVEAQAADLAEKAARPTGAGGSLTLDPDLAIPRYVSAIDIHCQPGGYCHEAFDGDVSAGAIYDRSIAIYMQGTGMLSDTMGQSVADYVKAVWPDLAPRRILDMGCTVGHATHAYAAHWPDAELHAIDVTAPCLRYAHARAEALGTPIHFSQQDAANTRFEDESFDLIVSTALLHETSNRALPDIFAECARLLRPGGLMVHADLPQFDEVDAFRQFIYDNETRHNNEPFWSRYRSLDLVAIAEEAGFGKGNAYRDFARVKAGRDRARVRDAIAQSRRLGADAKPGGILGWAFIIGEKVPS